MAFSFKIEGVEDLQKAFEKKRKEVEEVFKKDLPKGADKVLADAKNRAPKGTTHNLEDAIEKNELWNRGGKWSIYVGIAVNDVFTKADGWYARMQEIGTSKMPAHPYLKPALNENKKQIQNRIESDIKAVINKDNI